MAITYHLSTMGNTIMKYASTPPPPFPPKKNLLRLKEDDVLLMDSYWKIFILLGE